MNITNVEAKLSERGIKLERLYTFSSGDFSVLHQRACEDFLDRDITHHEFYCDMKRLESINVGDIAICIYGGNLIDGFPTSVRIDDSGIEKYIDAFSWDGVENVLVFELTHNKKHPVLDIPSVPAGKVYELIKQSDPYTL